MIRKKCFLASGFSCKNGAQQLCCLRYVLFPPVDFPITRSTKKGRKFLRKKLHEKEVYSNCKHFTYS